MMEPKNIWAVKLGGSLADSHCLIPWLEALSQTSAIIVPGGGLFADAVRQAQMHWHFDEQTAHHMAILAMRQYGRMLVGLCPKLVMATTLENLAKHIGNAVVWLPDPESLDEEGIPATWDISSDSLAAWLSNKLCVKNLLLVKSIAELDKPDDKARELTAIQAAEAGWVDPAFNHYAMNQPFKSWLCGPVAYAKLPQGFIEPARSFILLRS